MGALPLAWHSCFVLLVPAGGVGFRPGSCSCFRNMSARAVARRALSLGLQAHRASACAQAGIGGTQVRAGGRAAAAKEPSGAGGTCASVCARLPALARSLRLSGRRRCGTSAGRTSGGGARCPATGGTWRRERQRRRAQRAEPSLPLMRRTRDWAGEAPCLFCPCLGGQGAGWQVPVLHRVAAICARQLARAPAF